MNLPYPTNGYVIEQNRLKGLRPSGPLIVALNGDPHLDNATVYANPGQSYNWRWVKGLPSVIVLIGADTRFGTILRDIEDCEPGQHDVIDTERELGWMVLFARPKLVTLKWPKWMVRDWLGDGEWHTNLNTYKASQGLVTA